MAASVKAPREIHKAGSLKHIPWCEEYEKMISGMLYDSLTPVLEAARFKARKCAVNYNRFWPENASSFEELLQERRAILEELLGYIEEQVCIEPPFSVDYGCNIKVGKDFYSNFNLVIVDSALVTIGDRVMCGPNVAIFTASHPTDVRIRRENIEFARAVTIGDDCWIGGNVVILPGVTIGQGCTVAAGSVVTKDVPAWSVVMGQPARVVRQVERVDHDSKEGE
ncbi:hypothetical protein NW762_009298 [Fusarium torreyae]|uniref:Maltose/galactoside acetyltransferase domain-containing protein n=1 Tax=Fusarium torreyae TaxID=1237075 RepID=A0A9W8VEN9_9HYPO|nr:hypothetical protein NW762_009298 [Fusarium torreyae]